MTAGSIGERVAVLRILKQADDLDCLNENLINAAVMAMAKDLDSDKPRDRARAAGVMAQFARLGLMASSEALEVERDMIPVGNDLIVEQSPPAIEDSRPEVLEVSFIHDDP